MCYLISLVLSLSAMIMTILLMFADEESEMFKYFGETEVGVLLCVSSVLLVIGLIRDKR